uniref:Uncharacterized protein n=1 Tax=Cacopsylla melanoneura TaxID=428564 RepID=A0A8D8QHC5_9HEMI
MLNFELIKFAEDSEFSFPIKQLSENFKRFYITHQKQIVPFQKTQLKLSLRQLTAKRFFVEDRTNVKFQIKHKFNYNIYHFLYYIVSLTVQCILFTKHCKKRVLFLEELISSS